MIIVHQLFIPFGACFASILHNSQKYCALQKLESEGLQIQKKSRESFCSLRDVYKNSATMFKITFPGSDQTGMR